MIEELAQFIQQNNLFYAYLFLFFSAYIENIFPPAPADMVVVFGAYFVGKGILSFKWVLISTIVGSTLGFLSLYFLAFFFETRIMEKKFLRWVKKSAIEKTQNWFHKYGYWIIFLNRFLAGFRSVISISAGLSKLEWKKVTILSFLSASIWNSILVYIGYILGENWNKIGIYLKNYSLFIIFTAVLIGLYYWYRNRKRRKKYE